MKKQAVLILAEGFEEVEAVTPADILRRAGVPVTIAGLGGTLIKGSHGVTVKADKELSEIDFVPDALILPGGSTGAKNLAGSPLVAGLVKSCTKKGSIVAAICASPAIVLAPLGTLDGKKATCYPGMEKDFPPKVTYVSESVVIDGAVITSRGVGTTLAFSLALTRALAGESIAETVAKAIVYKTDR